MRNIKWLVIFLLFSCKEEKEMNLLMHFMADRGERLILDNVTYPNDPGYQTVDLMVQGLGGYQWSPIIWTIQDKTFVVVSEKSVPNKYYIYIYDHFRNKVSDAIDTGLTAKAGRNIHHICALIGNSINKLLLMQTSDHGSSGDWKYSITPTNYDVNNFPVWTDSGVNLFTYHQLQVFSNGDIYNAGRYAHVAVFGELHIYKSTDNGDNFSLIGTILDWVQTNNSVPYLNLIYSNDDVLRLYVNESISQPVGTVIGFPRTYYLESHDGGVTWRNIDNSFSKDIVASGALTLAEMKTNMLAWDLADNTHSIRATSAELIDGNPHIIGGSGLNTNSPLALYYWSGSAWIQKVITCAGHDILRASGAGVGHSIKSNNGSGIFKNGSNIDLVCSELVSSKAQISRFRSSDNGTTWTFIEQFTTNDIDHMNGQINKNISASDYKVIACTQETVVGATHRLFVKAIE